jgi:hypothetical protein
VVEGIFGSYTASVIHAASLALKAAGLVLLTQLLLMEGLPTMVKHTCYAACEYPAHHNHQNMVCQWLCSAYAVS